MRETYVKYVSANTSIRVCGVLTNASVMVFGGTEMRMCSMWSFYFLLPVNSPAGLIFISVSARLLLWLVKLVSGTTWCINARSFGLKRNRLYLLWMHVLRPQEGHVQYGRECRPDNKNGDEGGWDRLQFWRAWEAAELEMQKIKVEAEFALSSRESKCLKSAFFFLLSLRAPVQLSSLKIQFILGCQLCCTILFYMTSQNNLAQHHSCRTNQLRFRKLYHFSSYTWPTFANFNSNEEWSRNLVKHLPC